jgi:hypothetical protein
MMGLEPTTFCMARVGNRSRPFAPVAQPARLCGSRQLSERHSERERTSSVATVATPLTENHACFLGGVVDE